jgi:tungstate transport system substrate-binding protein
MFPAKGTARAVLALALSASLLMGLFAQTAPANKKIRLATTTSTEQSGLLSVILPEFEKDSGYQVDVVAVGTGAALKLGEKGDADVVLVHARAQEDAYVAAGFGTDRKDLMYNDFVILGPKSDPAKLAKAKNVAEAFAALAKAQLPFISRGDKSGTDTKEKEIWKAAGINPSGAWYKEAGQGMSQVIIMAESIEGYTLSDRATWLAMRDKSKLTIVFQGDKGLFNPYGIIATAPNRYPGLNYEGAKALIAWLASPRGQKLIADYKIAGEQLFYLYR